MKKYKYVLFDLDGTLVYSHPGIFACFRYALEKMGRENPTDKQLLPVIGPSLHYSFSTFFGMTDEEATQAVAFYRERYAVKGVWENDPIEGALQCLKTLKKGGMSLALPLQSPFISHSKLWINTAFRLTCRSRWGAVWTVACPRKPR